MLPMSTSRPVADRLRPSGSSVTVTPGELVEQDGNRVATSSANHS